ncbi:ABC transporter permease/substrate-binding protein [Croceicoccus mobilis]|uniref:ABC transporter permease n=1 Tax=Croceicoccus mobilis TaxID=1703339 RepID=A0A916Z850_9SPHN|nr:ABC transporter permease/substrate-binding protein [Croceicoccus mobilis]GGD80984.1 ABC transporter permease [Croceicoccus mobilis]
MNAFDAALAQVPALLQAHLALSLTALVLACAIGLPVALVAVGRPALRTAVLGVTSVVQTIPGLALLALFYPALLLAGRVTGLDIPALGFLPAVMALTLYAMLPIVRNAVTGIEQVDPVLVDVANGLGMTGVQRLRMVQIPLAAPVILAGVRTAAIWTIGTATLATTVGQPTLGNLIFSGLQTENWTAVLVGCLFAAVIAIVADALLGLLESGLSRRSRVRQIIAGLGLAALCILPFAPLTSDGGPDTVTIGAKNFSEQYILAELMAGRLQEAGFKTERRDNLGSAVAYRALASGDIDVYVDYTGTLWANVLGRDDRPSRDDMLSALSRELDRRDGVLLLEPLGFENAYALAMRRDRAAREGIASLADLARVSPGMTLGTDLEFTDRPEWQSVEDGYAMRFGDTVQYSPTFMYRAIADGSVDAISAFSSDGRIKALDLVTLSDPRGRLPRYDAVILLSPHARKDKALVAALSGLGGSIDIDTMRQANLMVDRAEDKQTPRQAARWIARRKRRARR